MATELRSGVITVIKHHAASYWSIFVAKQARVKYNIYESPQRIPWNSAKQVMLVDSHGFLNRLRSAFKKVGSRFQPIAR
jgi:hypothetical protein